MNLRGLLALAVVWALAACTFNANLPKSDPALNAEAQFESGRHLAAWLGLTPRARSSSGKQRLGSISRAGHERVRQLLVVGAMAVIRHASKPGARLASPWLAR